MGHKFHEPVYDVNNVVEIKDYECIRFLQLMLVI